MKRRAIALLLGAGMCALCACGAAQEGAASVQTARPQPAAAAELEPEDAAAALARELRPGCTVTDVMDAGEMADANPAFTVVSGEMLAADGLVSEEAAAELRRLNAENQAPADGLLVFLDGEALPACYAARDGSAAFLARSGKDGDHYMVLPVWSDELADGYAAWLDRAETELYDRGERLFEMQYIIQGDVRAVDPGRGTVLVDGRAERYDGADAYFGAILLHIAADEVIWPEDFFMKGYLASDCGLPAEQNDSEGCRVFYSVACAAAGEQRDRTYRMIGEIEQFRKILENAPPLRGTTRTERLGALTVSFTVPAEWEGVCEIEALDSGIAFYHTPSKEILDGGWLFSIALEAEEDYRDYPSYQVYSRAVGGGKDLIILYPTDVQFPEETAAGYQAANALSPGVIDSIVIESEP